MILPYGENLTVRVVQGRYASPLILETKVPPVQAGVVERVGPRAQGVAVGDKVLFATGHLQHKPGKQIQQTLDALGENEGGALVLLKWYDIFLVAETFEGLDVGGRRWD